MNAWRTGVRLSPSCWASSFSLSRAPPAKRPSSRRCLTCAYARGGGAAGRRVGGRARRRGSSEASSRGAGRGIRRVPYTSASLNACCVQALSSPIAPALSRGRDHVEEPIGAYPARRWATTCTATGRARTPACSTRPGPSSTCCTPAPPIRPAAPCSRPAAGRAPSRHAGPAQPRRALHVGRRLGDVARRGRGAPGGGRHRQRGPAPRRRLRAALPARLVRPRLRVLRARAPVAAGRGRCASCAPWCAPAGR